MAARERLVTRSEGPAAYVTLALMIAIVAGIIVSTLVAMRRWWLPVLASAEGSGIDRLLTTILAIIGVAFVLVQLVLAFTIVRFRRRGEQRAASWHGNRTLELAWTITPAAILVTLTAIGGGLWLRVRGAPPPGAMVVEVVAQQFGWTYHYPGPDGRLGAVDFASSTGRNPLGLSGSDPAAADDVVTRELHLVAGQSVLLRIRARDVIHSFFIPNFRFKQDALPGRTVQVWLTPTVTGRFPVACAELCGVGHYVMASTLVVDTPEAFAAWLAERAGATT